MKPLVSTILILTFLIFIILYQFVLKRKTLRWGSEREYTDKEINKLLIQSFGAIKGICAALNLPIFFVRPSKWKKYFELINSSKDSSRTKAIEMYPKLSNLLAKKKDVNKSDAILIARFFSETRFTEEN